MDGTSPDKNTLLLTLNQSHVIATVKTLSREIKQPVFNDLQPPKLLRSPNGARAVTVVKDFFERTASINGHHKESVLEKVDLYLRNGYFDLNIFYYFKIIVFF